jgi:hypothetical protein
VIGPLGLPVGLPAKLPDIMLIPCRPVDISGLPRIEGIDLRDVVTIEHTRILCDECARPCWIGPRQQRVWEQHQDRAVRACYFCTFKIADANLDPGETMALYDLGGGKAPRRGV